MSIQAKDHLGIRWDWYEKLLNQVSKPENEDPGRKPVTLLDDQDILQRLCHPSQREMVANILRAILGSLNVSLLCYVLGIGWIEPNQGPWIFFKASNPSWPGYLAFRRVLVNPQDLRGNHFMESAFTAYSPFDINKHDLQLSKAVAILAAAATETPNVASRNTVSASSSRVIHVASTARNGQQQQNDDLPPTNQLMSNLMINKFIQYPIGRPIMRALRNENPLPLAVLALIRNGADLTRRSGNRKRMSALEWLFMHRYSEDTLSGEHLERVKRHWGTEPREWMEKWWDAHVCYNCGDVKKTLDIWVAELGTTIMYCPKDEDCCGQETRNAYRFLLEKAQEAKVPRELNNISRLMDEAKYRLEMRSKEQGESYTPPQNMGGKKHKHKEKKLGVFSSRWNKSW